jgi:hypothetical protein
MKGHKDGILMTQWSRGVLYTASYDSSIKLWDAFDVSRIINPEFVGKAVCLHIDEFGAAQAEDVPIERLPSQIMATKFESAQRLALSKSKSIISNFGLRVKTSGWTQKPGIIVEDLIVGGPAHECGLRPRDTISLIENVQVTSVSTVEMVLENMKPGSKSCIIQVIKSIESNLSVGSLTGTETPELLHDYEVKFGVPMQPQLDSSLSWLHVLNHCPASILGTSSMNDQVRAITEFFAGIPDVFSALFSKFGLKWKKTQSSGTLTAPFLTNFELCEFLLASKLVKPHCSVVKLVEMFSENAFESRESTDQPVPFWHTKYVYYTTFVMLGMLRLACIKYSKKLPSITARLSHLIEKHIQPSLTRPEVYSSAHSHHVILANEEKYGDLSMFLSVSEKQLLGRCDPQIEAISIDDTAEGLETLR